MGRERPSQARSARVWLGKESGVMVCAGSTPAAPARVEFGNEGSGLPCHGLLGRGVEWLWCGWLWHGELLLGLDCYGGLCCG